MPTIQQLIKFGNSSVTNNVSTTVVGETTQNTLTPLKAVLSPKQKKFKETSNPHVSVTNIYDTLVGSTLYNNTSNDVTVYHVDVLLDVYGNLSLYECVEYNTFGSFTDGIRYYLIYDAITGQFKKLAASPGSNTHFAHYFGGNGFVYLSTDLQTVAVYSVNSGTFGNHLTNLALNTTGGLTQQMPVVFNRGTSGGMIIGYSGYFNLINFTNNTVSSLLNSTTKIGIVYKILNGFVFWERPKTGTTIPHTNIKVFKQGMSVSTPITGFGEFTHATNTSYIYNLPTNAIIGNQGSVYFIYYAGTVIIQNDFDGNNKQYIRSVSVSGIEGYYAGSLYTSYSLDGNGNQFLSDDCKVWTVNVTNPATPVITVTASLETVSNRYSLIGFEGNTIHGKYFSLFKDIVSGKIYKMDMTDNLSTTPPVLTDYDTISQLSIDKMKQPGLETNKITAGQFVFETNQATSNNSCFFGVGNNIVSIENDELINKELKLTCTKINSSLDEPNIGYLYVNGDINGIVSLGQRVKFKLRTPDFLNNTGSQYIFKYIFAYSSGLIQNLQNLSIISTNTQNMYLEGNNTLVITNDAGENFIKEIVELEGDLVYDPQFYYSFYNNTDDSNLKEDFISQSGYFLTAKRTINEFGI